MPIHLEKDDKGVTPARKDQEPRSTKKQPKRNVKVVAMAMTKENFEQKHYLGARGRALLKLIMYL